MVSLALRLTRSVLIGLFCYDSMQMIEKVVLMAPCGLPGSMPMAGKVLWVPGLGEVCSSLAMIPYRMYMNGVDNDKTLSLTGRIVGVEEEAREDEGCCLKGIR